jgi:hypothetical protein
MLFLVAAVLLSCKKEKGAAIPVVTPPVVIPPGTPPVIPAVMLKEIVIPNLPSPYYHFEYDMSGTVKLASFASDFKRYDINYENGKIGSLVNNIAPGVQEVVKYAYDNLGRVMSVIYTDVTGVNNVQVSFNYQGNKLVRLERQRLSGQQFFLNKVMTFTYYDDGNLKELVDFRPAIANIQTESTSIDRFEQYDNKINVDGFSLIHNDFFDQLVLLPGVQLQINNPGKETVTGDGTNYTGTYTYSYNDHDLPLTKTGHFSFTNGNNAGQTFETNSTFSYYQ